MKPVPKTDGPDVFVFVQAHPQDVFCYVGRLVNLLYGLSFPNFPSIVIDKLLREKHHCPKQEGIFCIREIEEFTNCKFTNKEAINCKAVDYKL